MYKLKTAKISKVRMSTLAPNLNSPPLVAR